LAWLVLLTALVSASLSGCALFGAQHESTVAQGKYYASGNAYYDQFFVELYLLQVGLAEAPKVPEAERQRLTQLLKLDLQATPAMIEQRLREEASSLSRAGIHLRLDQSSLVDGPGAARAEIRSNARPQQDPARQLLTTIEASGTNLLRWQLKMKQQEAALSRLELMTIGLDAGVDRAFSQAPVGKPSEVKQNLADAHKLIPLMRARSRAVRESSERLLAALTHGIFTDDGSIGPPLDTTASTIASPPDSGSAPVPAKATAGKARPKSKTAAADAPAGKAASPARPRPPTASSDSDAPQKARAPSSKPAAPPRDFEP